MIDKDKTKYGIRRRTIRRRTIKYGMFAMVTLLALFSLSMAVNAVLIEEGNVSGLTVTPDPARIGSGIYIKFNLLSSSYVTVNIYKAGEYYPAGELQTPVRTIWNNISRPAGSLSTGWDGKDSSGVLVPDGNYKIVVTARDAQGNQVGYSERIITAARVPSLSSVSDSPDPFNPVVGEQAAINYKLSANAMVTVTILKDYTAIRTLTVNEPQTGGVAQTVYWDGKDAYGNLVPDRSYNYQIDAVSPTVPSFKSTYRGTTTVEKENPQINNISATPDPLRISINNMSIKYNLSEDARVTMEIVNEAGTAVRTLLDGTVLKRAGDSGIGWDGKNDAGRYVPEGTYSIVVSAIDNAGKSSGNQSITFKAGYYPTISGFSADPAMFNPDDPEAASSRISYRVSDDALVTVDIYNGYNKVRTLVDSAAQSGGVEQSVYWDGTDETGKVVGDADYTVEIKAVSPTVSAFNSTYKGTVAVEKGAPGIYNVSLNPEPYRLGTSSLSIQYSLTENAAVDVYVYKGDAFVKQLASGLNKYAGSNGISWDGKDSSGSVITEGIYTITIKAVDKYGKADQAQNNVTCGFQPTISTVSHTPELFNPTADVSLAVYFNLSSDANVNLTVLKGSAIVRTQSLGVMSAGLNSAAWDGKDNGGQFVTDGSYYYQLEAVSPTVDSFKTTYRGTLTVEGNSPVLSEMYVSPTVAKIGSNATFRYTLSEPATMTGQVLKSDGTVVRDFLPEIKTIGSSYSLAWDTRDNAGNFVSTGDYLLKLKAVDNYGKMGFGELAFKAGAVPVMTDVYADPATIGMAGLTNIRFTVSENSIVTARMYNSAGAVVETLCSYKRIDAGTNSIAWDGKDYKGNLVAGTFSYKIDAVSVLGNFKGVQASGTVQVTSTIVGTNSCVECHTSYPAGHSVDNCFGCHGNNEPAGSIHEGNLECASCHGPHSASLIGTYDCTFCHNDTYSYKVPNHVADNSANHISTSLDASCATCHQNNVTVEHIENTATQSTPGNCNTCHTNSGDIIKGAISASNTQCAACHRQQHNVNFAETVPADIPLYSNSGGGMTWTPPRDAFLWAGESWMPDEFVSGGKVVMSDRHTDLSGDVVYGFYTTQMAANGWTVEPHAQVVSDCFSLTFTKEGRRAVVWFYGGESHNSSPVAATGYKIDILYK